MGSEITGGSSSMDMAEHMRTYNGFIRLTVWLIAFLILLLAGMAYFLV